MHKTARARNSLSVPMRGFIAKIKGSHLDYGCGRGGDVIRLRELFPNQTIKGYDPNSAHVKVSPSRLENFSEKPDDSFHTVSLIYVLNVIPSIEQRAEVLIEALNHCEDMFLLACRVDPVEGTEMCDGVITSKGTFQTQVSHDHWRTLLDMCLEYTGRTATVLPVAKGVFWVKF